MEKTARAELIAALVTDKYSGFKDGDESLLEAASDARLEEFRAASETHKAAERAFSRLETEHRNVGARLKVAEDRIKAGEQELSEEDFLQRAPASIKALVEGHKAEEAAMRASIISQLKDLGANTEEELKKKSTEDLKTLATYARVNVPDFSGRGLAQERTGTETKRSYAPPDPYKGAIKALQGQSSKAVN
jgi:hypothetical protein